MSSDTSQFHKSKQSAAVLKHTIINSYRHALRKPATDPKRVDDLYNLLIMPA